jgi:Bacterial Ig-like domain (group 3)
VTRVVTVLVMALVASLAGLYAASPANAVTTSVPYILTSGDPVLSAPLGTDSAAPCVAGSGSGTFPYKVVRFKVSVTGSYTLSDGGAGDGRVGVYTGAFSPAAPTTNCLAFVDDDETMTLTAGTTYTMVQSSSTGATGGFSVTFDGDGTPTVLTSTTTTLTTTPNPSELSKATTLKATVAGGATPTGTVQFRNGATLLGSVALSGGVAQLAVSSLAVGSHTLSATYLGDGTHDVSVDTHVHKVKYGPRPKVKLSVSDKTPYIGQKIRLTWVTVGADKVRARGDWSGKLAKKGSKRIKIKRLGFHAFKIKATNVNGSTKDKVKVVAQRAPKDLRVTVPSEFLTVDTRVRVKAAGLDAKERFKVFLDKVLLAKGYADRRGHVSVLVRIPKDTKEGDHTLTVMGSNRARLGIIDVVVLTPKKLDVEVEKATVMINRTQTVTVEGLVEGEAVTVMLDGEVLVEGEADADGEFEHTFSVGDELGLKTLEVTGGVPSRLGEATFKVTPGAGPDV